MMAAVIIFRNSEFRIQNPEENKILEPGTRNLELRGK